MARWKLILLLFLVTGTSFAQDAPAAPAVVERLTKLYGSADLAYTGQKDPLGHLLALQQRQWPQAWVTSTFYDWRTISKYRRQAGLHLGYDIALPFGTAVSAGWPGTVTAIIPWTSTEYGVAITGLDGTVVTYGHVTPTVTVGQKIVTGQIVGRIASDHVDVKMRDARGHYLPFGESTNSLGPRVARLDRNSLLTTWLVAHSTAQQASDELFYAENAEKKWELEARSASRRLQSLEKTLEQVRGNEFEGLISRRRLEELKAEKSAAQTALQQIKTKRASTPDELAQAHQRAQSQLAAIESWAVHEGLTWSDVENLIKRTVAADQKLALTAARQRQSLSSRSLSVNQLKMKIKNSRERLEKLEELYSVGGLSKEEMEDHRLAHQLLQEEYELRKRRKKR